MSRSTSLAFRSARHPADIRSHGRRREEETTRRLVGASALPILHVARHRSVRMGDRFAAVENVTARRDPDLLLGYYRAVEGVAAPFAGGVGATLLVDPDVVCARRRAEGEQDQGGGYKALGASSHERP